MSFAIATEDCKNKKSVFETLSAVNVNDHIEKKNGLSYLSWAWAWGILKKYYPSATYKIYEDDNGFLYHTDGRTAWVKVGVTVEGIENVEYLPIMDYRNRSIPIDNVTSMDANKAVQRALTKAVARHGLGLYIYAGEDLPEPEQEEVKKKRADAKKQKPTAPKPYKKEEPKQAKPEKSAEPNYRNLTRNLIKKYEGDNWRAAFVALGEQCGIQKDATNEDWKAVYEVAKQKYEPEGSDK